VATFRYAGFLPNGKKRKGFINADDLLDAKHKLLHAQFLLTKIEDCSPKKSPSLSKSEVLIFTRELSKLLKAGLPLFEALVSLEEKYQGHKFHPVLIDLCAAVKEGRSFSKALARHASCFDRLYLCMIENAESTGSLSQALDELSQLTSKSLSLKKQLLAALLYPSLLASFCLAVLGTLLFYIIPSLADLFEGRSLHPFTAFILALSKWVNVNKGALILALLAVACSVMICFFSKKGKNVLFSLSLRIPVLGSLMSKVALARFCRSCSALLHSGLPFLESLRLGRKVIRHPPIEKVLEDAEMNLLRGGNVSAVLQASPHIPSLFVRMLSLAEISGNLPVMMLHLSEIYEEELEKSFSKITQMAQPILLLFFGAVIGLVLLSVLMPLTDVGSFLENS
jgi:general secretion pathway protein F